MKTVNHPKASDFELAKLQFIEKVAAGLRTMRGGPGAGAPDYFLFLSGPIRDEFAFAEILGIPVIEAPTVVNSIVPERIKPDTSGKIHCPIVPLWKGEVDLVHDYKVQAFQKGYMNA